MRMPLVGLTSKEDVRNETPKYVREDTSLRIDDQKILKTAECEKLDPKNAEKNINQNLRPQISDMDYTIHVEEQLK